MVPPPALLNTSPETAWTVTVFEPPKVTILTATMDPDGAPCGSVTVTFPLAVDTGTIWLGNAV